MDTDYVYTFELEGQKLTAAIVPDSWMYRYHGLEIEVALEPNGGTVRRLERKTLFVDATEADVQRLAHSIQLLPCKMPQCNRYAFDPRTVQTPTGGFCQQCFKDHLTKMMAREARVDRRERLQEYLAWKAEGTRYVVMAWIHPMNGGQDYPYDFGFERKPTAAKIRAELVRQGCSVRSDYQVYQIDDIIAELQKPPH